MTEPARDASREATREWLKAKMAQQPWHEPAAPRANHTAYMALVIACCAFALAAAAFLRTT